MDLIEKAAQKLQAAEKESLVERAARKLENTGEPVVRPGGDKPPPSDVPAPSEAADAPIQTATRSVGPGSSRRSRRADIDLEHLHAQGVVTPHGDPTQIAEEFRIVKRAILAKAFGKGDNAIKNGNLILVSSAQPSEGKTFCAINLAMSVASERDLTVLLVDADFANPSVLTMLGLEGGKGLFDIIDDENMDIAECLIRTNLDNLTVLPAGHKHRLTTELLASERMHDIVDDIVMRYPDRLIILDSPPILASSAPGALAAHVGQIMFVVEAERTSVSQVKTALIQISECKNINLLLNKSRLTTGSEMFRQYYGYYYGYGQKTA